MPGGSSLRRTLFVAAALGCARPAPAPPMPQAPPIDTLILRAHTSFLAHDLLKGRGTGEPGAAVAAAYIAAQCRGLGLVPLGREFLLDVPLEAATVRRNETVLTITHGADSAAFRPGDGFIVAGGRPAALASFGGRPVYLGTADEIRQTGEALPDLTGRVAVTGGVLRADLAERLAARGAAGLVQLTSDLEAYALYRASRAGALTLLADSTVPSSFHPSIPAVILAPHVAPVLAEAIRDSSGAFDVRLAFDRRPISAWNVACVLPGRDPRAADTLIALTAHYDHLGISVPDERGDSIYNGFSDDAAGVAMLFAVARAIRSPAGGLRHGLALLFFTGEERGLLGSDYFVARPPVPLTRVRAVVNLDAGAPPARPWNWRVAGGEGTPLGAVAVDVAASRGWAATLSPPSANSDYFPFLRSGVPAVFLIPGTGPYEGLSTDSSQALRRQWDRYHQAGDEYFEAFPFAGLQRYAEYALLLVQAIDRR